MVIFNNSISLVNSYKDGHNVIHQCSSWRGGKMFKIIESDCSNIKLPEDNIERF